MTTQLRPKQEHARMLKTRIMRVLTPAIIAVFAFISLFGSGMVVVNTWRNYNQIQNLSLEDTQDHFTDELGEIFADLRDVSTSVDAQGFAQAALSPDDAITLGRMEEALITQMSVLLKSDPGRYRTVRYIDQNGSVWIVATAPDGNLSTVTDVAFRERQPDTDTILSRGLQTEVGAVNIGELRVEIEDINNTAVPIMTITSPVSRPDEPSDILGVVELEVDLTGPLSEIRNAPQINPRNTASSRYIVLDNRGQLVVDSGVAVADYLPQLGDDSPNYQEDLADLVAFVETRPSTFSTQTWFGGLKLVAAVELNIGDAPTMPWRLIVTDSLVGAFSSTLLLTLVVIVVSGLTGAGLWYFADTQLTHLLRRIGFASEKIREIATQGQIDLTPTPSSTMPPDLDPQRDPDEGTEIIYAAENIAREFERLNTEIQQRTERYNRNLSVAARIGREAATLEDMNELLNRAIDLISSSFGLYHAQVFLVDETSMNAVLRYSQGNAGQQLLELQHKLPVGSKSVIGRVTATGRPVVVNDTLTSEAHDTHLMNPILKDTRSEMALPLQIGDTIIGALDLQSDKPNTFAEEDIQTFQLLADQIAIAVYNTQLLRQSDQRIRQIETLNRQLTQMAWEELEREVGLDRAYRYNLLEVEAGEFNDTKNLTTAQLFAVPITIRGEAIGTIHAAPPDGADFTENDRIILRSVADRVALAVENARLFQETQTNLAETSTLYQTSRYLNEADEMEDIIQAIVLSAMPNATRGQVAIFDDYPFGTYPEWMQIMASWVKEAPDVGKPTMVTELVGTRFRLERYTIFSELSANQVTLISDTERDVRLDSTLRDWFVRQLDARSVVFIPLSVRGIWRGTVMIEFDQPRDFTEREGRIYNNLIDQAGVAIDNRLLLRQTEHALTQNERLYAASRTINQAESERDLVMAAVNTTDKEDLNFGLAVFEGKLDSTGWPTSIRHIAQSHGTEIYEPDQVYFVRIAEDSPMRKREPETILVDREEENKTLSLLAALIRSNDDKYGVVFPLFSANQPIALFFVSRATHTPLTDENEEIYRALTGQMSTVIQNRRLLQRTEAALDETRRLYDASRAVTDAQDVNAMYLATAEHLSSKDEDAFRVTFLLARPVPSYTPNHLERTFTFKGDEPNSVDTTSQRFDRNVVPFSNLPEFTAKSTELAYIQQQLEQYPDILAYLVENRTRSVAFLALESRQSWLGVILVESKTQYAFDEQYIRFAQAVGDQAAIALENQLLFEQAQQEARQALALAEASQLVSQIGGEIIDGLQNLFARVAETAGYDRWLLMELDASGTMLTVMTEQVPEGNASIAPDQLDLSIAEHSIVDAIHFNRTLLINNPLTHTSLQSQPELAKALGKHIAAPIVNSERVVGALCVGRSMDEPDLTERDDTLINTMANQIAARLENQRLFVEAERERNTLRSILNTLPAGVLVMDASTLKPVQSNAQMREYLGQDISEDVPFSAEYYNLYRTGTNMFYPNEELPITASVNSGETAFSDDVSVILEDGQQRDLLINAAPIINTHGEVTNIVAAFEDISNLRSLENTLQDNLRETISLYEATRSLSEADELNEVLDVVLFQLIMNEPEDAHVVLLDEEAGGLDVSRNMVNPLEVNGLTESVLNPDRITLIDNVQTEGSITEEDRIILQNQNIEAIACVPMRAAQRGMSLGWIVVNYSQPHQFTPEDERFLSTLGDNAAVAIDNRYLFQSTQRALRETSSLYSATTTISRARDLGELSQMIRVSVEALSPDIYAAYLMTDPSSPDNLEEMFNISMDVAEIDFQKLLMQYGLFRDTTIVIDDVQALANPTPFELALADYSTIRGFASVSLRVKGMPDGRLFLAYHNPHYFTEGETRYLNAIADSASVVIDNIILLGQIQDALEETSTLYQASRALAKATSPEEVLNVVVEKLIGVHVNQVFLALLTSSSWEGSGATVQIVSNWQSDGGIDLEGISLTAEQFPAWNTLSSPTVVTIDDVQTDPNLDEMERLGMSSLDTRSLTIIPLRAPLRNIGTVWISSRQPHHYSEREQRIFQAFAEQASLSLEASFLLDQTERRARQLATSTEVSQIVSSILDLDVLLPQVVDLIQEQFGYDHVQVFLMDAVGEFAELKASTGEPGQQLLSIGHKLAKGSQSVIGQVTEQARPIIALDTSDARVVHRPNPYLPLTRSEMALPIIVQGDVIGALDVQSNQPNAFAEDDIAVLTTLAAQISVAIDNARLFEQAESRADEMSFLFTITTAAASADGLDEALQNVVELLRGSLSAQSVGVYLLESDDEKGEAGVMHMIALSGSEQPLNEVEAVVVGDEDNLIGTVAYDLIPVIIDDIRDEPRYLPLVSESRSAVIVPLNTGGDVTGLITMESERVGAYNQDTLTLLLALGGTLAAIVQNARLIEDISQKNTELEALDKLKSDFLANMSHELRTPLNSIIGFSRVMLKGIDGPLTEMQEQDLTTIYNSGQHLLGLINDVLDQAKISADKMDLQRGQFEIRTVVEGVRSIGIGLVKEKPVDIYLKMANNLPPAFGDEFRTRQVLLNLVSNSAKFTSNGSITISVYTFEHEEKGTMIRVDVADTGIGIDGKDLPTLFEAFRQVDSSLTRTVEGTGLGLPIAKSLVELQGGAMYVTSEIGMGSTFSITVPTDESQMPSISGEDEDEPEEDVATKPTTPQKSKVETTETASVVVQNNGNTAKVVGPPPGVFEQKRQILLIESDPKMVDQFRRVLQREGFEVFVASIPLEAEAMASGLRPTLIVMDVDFADGKGWDILATIKDRDDTFDIPVIIVTLNTDTERAYRLGAYSVIQRPYTPETLSQAVLEAEQESNVDRILVIDDQPESTRLIEQILQSNGKYRVFAAHTGTEGIALVARRRPDLIVLDLRMPGMDGFAVLDDLRSQPESANIPVVVVTGESVLSEDEREKLVNLEIIYKTDLNQENYDGFIEEVRRQISRYHGE